MLDGTGSKTTNLFDEFEESKEKFLFLRGFRLSIYLDSEKYYIYLIVTKRGTGYDNITMVNSDITISDIKKLSSSKSIKININTLEDLTDIDIADCPNISLPVYKFLLMISKFIRENRTRFLAESESNYKNDIVMNFLYPILLRAQNSKNKTGYGWEWSWNCLVSEGTLYGETTGYPIVGCLLVPGGSTNYYCDDNLPTTL